jgi:hypothetical protein
MKTELDLSESKQSVNRSSFETVGSAEAETGELKQNRERLCFRFHAFSFSGGLFQKMDLNLVELRVFRWVTN